MAILKINPERTRVITKLNELAKGGDTSCRWCGHDALIIPSQLVDLPRYYGPEGPPFEGKETLPCIAAICQRCGFVHSFHADSMKGVNVKLDDFDPSLKKEADDGAPTA